MTRPRLLSVVLLAAGLWIGAAASPSGQRSPGRERSLYVSVVDQNGAPVPDLGPSDFQVKEDNMAREILRVTNAETPMQIALLVDTSVAARDHISHIRQALPGFVTQMTKANAAGLKSEVAIIGLGERPTILSEYSSDPRQVQKGIDRVWSLPNAAMYLLDAIVEVSKGLKKREAPRPVMVAILTAGTDYSNLQHDQAIDPMKSAGVAFYVMALGQPDTSLSHEARERAIVLDEGTRVTGGSHEQLLTSMALTPKLKLLADQLTHMYKVTYSRPESLIPPEKIVVSATKTGLVARGTPVLEEQARP